MAPIMTQVTASLQQVSQKETLIGAVILCGKIFEVLDRGAFEAEFS